MRAQDRLQGFVIEALRQGHARTEIVAALVAAGWRKDEAQAALADWAEGPFPLPVPRPRASVSAREAFVYGLMFTALAVSVVQAVSLGFALTDMWLSPEDAARFGLGSWRIRSAVASLAVFLPLFLLFDRRVARAERTDHTLGRSAVRDWLSHAALYVAALTLIGNLISVLTAVLGGGLDLVFLVKSAIVAAVAGLVFGYFRRFTRAT